MPYRPTQHQWLGGLAAPDTHVELWSAAILVLWSIHQMRNVNSPAAEPVARAMYEVSQLQPPVMMFMLLGLGVAQFLSVYFYSTLWRRIVVFYAFCFYLFIVLAFWRFVPNYPGAYICISYAGVSFLQFVRLCRRKSA